MVSAIVTWGPVALLVSLAVVNMVGTVIYLIMESR